MASICWDTRAYTTAPSCSSAKSKSSNCLLEKQAVAAFRLCAAPPVNSSYALLTDSKRPIQIASLPGDLRSSYSLADTKTSAQSLDPRRTGSADAGTALRGHPRVYCDIPSHPGAKTEMILFASVFCRWIAARFTIPGPWKKFNQTNKVDRINNPRKTTPMACTSTGISGEIPRLHLHVGPM